MLPEITGSLSAIKNTIELIKAAKGVTDQAHIDSIFFDMREAMANVQEQLIGVQIVANTILEEQSNTQKALEEEQAKNIRLEGYSLIEARTGVFIYSYQEVEGDPTPPHTACPNCFSTKRVSILQKPNDNNSKIECPECDFSYNPRTQEETRSMYEAANARHRSARAPRLNT